MESLIKKCKEWADVNFEFQLNELANEKNSELIKIANESFSRLGILNKKVNGYASEGLQKSEEGASSANISYSETFHKIYDQSFNPTKYLFELISEFQRKKGNIKKIDGFLSRGLRTLTSLLREPDFAEKLKLYLRTFDNNTQTTLSSKQDSADHTDVFLKFKGHEFRIWLYQFSDRGLPHDIDRLTERRGALPAGIHVLCPLNTELAKNHGKLLARLEKKELSIINTKQKLNRISQGAIKAKKSVEERILRYNNEFLKIKLTIDKESGIMAEEIDVVAGWYFYSDKYIKKVGNEIVKIKTFDPYFQIKEMLMLPRSYISKVQFFEKDKA